MHVSHSSTGAPSDWRWQICSVSSQQGNSTALAGNPGSNLRGGFPVILHVILGSAPLALHATHPCCASDLVSWGGLRLGWRPFWTRTPPRAPQGLCCTQLPPSDMRPDPAQQLVTLMHHCLMRGLVQLEV